MIETFQETLQQMGVEPTGADPTTGEPQFILANIARAMGVREKELDASVEEAVRGS
jgi:hypothetical protein